MVQLLEELPPELQAHIAGSLDAAAAAGRWAQASRASRLLLVPRLEQLLEVRRSARQQAMLDKLSRPRRGAAAALSVVNDMGGGHFAINLAASGAQLRLSMATFTCMIVLRSMLRSHVRSMLRRRSHSALRQCFRQCAGASGFQSALGFTPPPSL